MSTTNDWASKLSPNDENPYPQFLRDLQIFLERWDLASCSQSELVIQSFIHSSFAHEQNCEDNEKLEFLGDSILGLIISDEIYKRFSDKVTVGELSKFKSALVSEKSLIKISTFLGLKKFSFLGKGQVAQVAQGKAKSYQADILEAFLAAIFLEKGLDFTRNFLLKVLSEIEKSKNGISFFDLDRLQDFDFKTKLQEKTMAIFRCLPEYRVLQSPTSIKPNFIISLYIQDTKWGETSSPSKREAQEFLAREALRSEKLC